MIPAARPFENSPDKFTGQRSASSSPGRQQQLAGEQKVDQTCKYAFNESYNIDNEIKDSVTAIIKQMSAGKGIEATRAPAYFNTHTKELVETYKDSKSKNEDGVGIHDFVNKMVLRFKS